jgi:hypothetical protein
MFLDNFLKTSKDQQCEVLNLFIRSVADPDHIF